VEQDPRCSEIARRRLNYWRMALQNYDGFYPPVLNGILPFRHVPQLSIESLEHTPLKLQWPK